MPNRGPFTFTMGEVFPADDPVARWLLTMSVGLNDLILANGLGEKSQHDYERIYFFRLASTHLWEITKFVTQSHDAWPEIQEFVQALPEATCDHLEAIKAISTTGELATVGPALVQMRDLFSHYQKMDEQARKSPRDAISKALAAMAGEEVVFEVSEVVRGLRLSYADDVIATAMMRVLPDAEAHKRMLGTLVEGVGHVARFTQLALDAWLEPRMHKLRGASKP